nr:hypothetical protein [Kofleriaceae bacterium]
MRPACHLVVAIAASTLACGQARTSSRHPPANTVVTAPPAEPGVVPALAGDGDRAYVVDDGALLEVSPRASQAVVTGASWCGADARANVVWFATDDGVSAFDLVDRRVHRVIRHALALSRASGGMVGEIAPIIDWGGERIGGENRVDFDIGVAIEMRATPTARSIVGCYMMADFRCRDDGGDWRPAIRELAAFADGIVVDDPAYVATLVARGAGRSLYAATPAAPPPPAGSAAPQVDKAGCNYMPDACGQLRAIPGTPWWLAVTGNSLGDYIDHTEQLWDPATREFVAVVDGKLQRSAAVPADSRGAVDQDGLRVSPSGRELELAGTVIDASHVIYAAKDGSSCGFAGGGWRVAPLNEPPSDLTPAVLLAKSGPVSLPASWAACSRDADCTVVSRGCCDTTAVDRDHAADATDVLRESDRPMCPVKSACGPSADGTWDGQPGTCVDAVCRLPTGAK